LPPWTNLFNSLKAASMRCSAISARAGFLRPSPE
jgi:hypothetical protein